MLVLLASRIPIQVDHGLPFDSRLLCRFWIPTRFSEKQHPAIGGRCVENRTGCNFTPLQNIVHVMLKESSIASPRLLKHYMLRAFDQKIDIRGNTNQFVAVSMPRSISPEHQLDHCHGQSILKSWGRNKQIYVGQTGYPYPLWRRLVVYDARRYQSPEEILSGDSQHRCELQRHDHGRVYLSDS